MTTLLKSRSRRKRPRPIALEAPLFAPEVLAAERHRREAALEAAMGRRTVGAGPLDEPPAVLEPAEVAALLAGLHEQLLAAEVA